MSYREGNKQGCDGSTGEAAANRRSKVTSERVALLVLSALLAAAAIVIYRLSFDNFQTKKNLHTLKDENEAMRKNLTAYDNSQTKRILQTLKGENEAMRKNLTECLFETKPCTTVQPKCPQPTEVITNKPSPKCGRGWEQLGGMCYLFSTNGKPWEDSRYFCQRQGADLGKTDSREEQSFLEYKLRNEMNFDDDKFWIGLTDSEEEGRWLWVDGSPLDRSLTFWSRGEPDDWKEKGPDGEDCASMGERAGAYDLKCWFDRPCYIDQSFICEKPA